MHCYIVTYTVHLAFAVSNAFFGLPLIDPILLDDVQCNGNETFITNCTRRQNGHDCSVTESAGVLCTGIETIQVSHFNEHCILQIHTPATVCSNGNIRFRDSNVDNDNEGIIQVCINQQWSDVCDESWSESDAIVACRQLGFADAGTNMACMYYMVTSCD